MLEGQEIYFTDQNLVASQNNNNEATFGTIKSIFRNFIHQFNKENVRIYQNQFNVNAQQGKSFLSVNLADIKSHDQQMYEKFKSNPLESLVAMEQALGQYALQKQKQFPKTDERWQIMIKSDQNPHKLRNIGSNLVSKIFVVQGIIVTSSKPYIKASVLKIQCKSCNHIKQLQINPGQTPYIPRSCTSSTNQQKCPLDSYVVLPSSQVIDVQSLKIQQNPQQIPTGQIPRTTSLTVDRYNVGKCVPGDRVKITGIMMVNDLKYQQLSSSYIYVTGVQKITERTSIHYSQQEQETFKKMSKDPKIYEKIFSSIAPGIYGSQDIKKAIACMLFGGSRKKLPDNTRLRGDINILLIGDPSTAKSQFLKFVQQTAPIGVYTSGKGSSAAGLTASISKDSTTGQFQIQGGALVLADGGIVCIDQFDKMKPGDRVAIHEAMQQQTISVAKAGITTRLNSRTSVLAAANPIFGRYDQLKQIQDQIELQSTILSRFDCIFIVRDLNTNQNNDRIATHILELHQGKTSNKHSDPEFPFQMLKKYISYAKNKFSPRLSHESSEKLQNLYVSDRQKSKEHKSISKNSMPITVRQLQAIIRLSEALAKMKLKDEVSTEHVDEAHRLFEVSTLKTIDGKEFGLQMPQNLSGDILKMQQAIKKRVCIGNVVTVNKLVDQLSGRFSNKIIEYAINNMVKNGEFRQVKGKKQLIREK